MKKTVLRIILGILIIITSNIFVFYVNLFILNIHEGTILKWTPLISTFIGFYFAGLVTRKVNVKYTLILFFPLLMFVPVKYFYFPLIIFITLFAILALALNRNEINKKLKVVFSITGILLFSYFLFNEPLIIRQEGFETTAEGNFINAKILWDFNDYETKVLPEEAFTNLKNEKIELNTFKGKTLYITFWATWCGPCLEEKPILDQLKADFKDSAKIVFIDISLDTDKSRWKSYLEKNKPSGIQLISQNENLTRRNFKLSGIPHHIIGNKLMEYKTLRNIPGAKKYLENENILNEWVKKERIVIEKK